MRQNLKIVTALDQLARLIERGLSSLSLVPNCQLVSPKMLAVNLSFPTSICCSC